MYPPRLGRLPNASFGTKFFVPCPPGADGPRVGAHELGESNVRRDNLLKRVMRGGGVVLAALVLSLSTVPAFAEEASSGTESVSGGGGCPRS